MNNNILSNGKLKGSAILFGISFPLLSFYTFTSGAYQPVDLIIVILSTFIIFTITHDELFEASRIILPFIPFLFWIICVNSYYIILSGHLKSYVIATIQLTYAFVIMFFYYIAIKRVIGMQQGRIYLILCLFLLAISPLIFSMFFGGSSTDFQIRQVYSFNNPNQLGYFSLLLLCMFLTYTSFYRYYSFLDNKIIQSIKIVVFLIGNWFVFVSASRGAIAGVLLLDFMILWMHLRKSPFICIGLIFIHLFTAGLIFSNDIFSNYFQGTLTRLTNKAFYDHDDLLHRSIEQLNITNEVSMFIGKGPRQFSESGLKDMYEDKGEVHNAIIGIFSQYGIIGVLLLFGGFSMYAWKVGFSVTNLAVFASIAIYNMSHYGLRFRVLWVVLALVAASSFYVSDRYKSQFFDSE
jgi:hypothetical protein